ncbi:hypothetical protein [Rhodococcus xishaensis]|uniref:Secreted protein n=1 Tax=Rhodococcus xishaensis TaxID=2487364 RepID=A0A438AYU6_9NOCA|nr:hypothetical protein [Rhodococcus xishaensis]RVW03891.1 hypothetical protein EGT50_05105 [Rhodococcus xishaensis]
MRTIVRRFAGFATAVTAAAALSIAGAGVATADEWPTPPPYPSPVSPFDYDGFLTPTDLEYWNPFVNEDRLTSPFGTSTRIVCTSFHGVLLDCWQADREGNPHKLVQLPGNYPGSIGSSQPGGGPSHFVYPGFIPGI